MTQIPTPPEGVILPPPEVREIIEKTAAYVFRNGTAFEARIRDQQANSADKGKFSFINQDDVFHGYYTWWLQQLEDGTVSTTSRSNTGQNVASGGSAVIPAKPKIPQEPGSFRFSAFMPPISALDLDVVKVTALFVAKNGSEYERSIFKREEKNYQFDFLRPNHSLNSLYRSYIKQYQLVLQPEEELLKLVKTLDTPDSEFMQKCLKRAEWMGYTVTQRRRKEEMEEEERIAYAEIDWNDFNVVETIDFTPADTRQSLPVPLKLAEVQFASLEQKKMGILRLEEAPPDFEEDEEEIRESRAKLRQKLAETSDKETTPSGVSERSTPEVAEEPKAPKNIRNMKIKAAGTTRIGHGKPSGEKLIECPVTHKMIPESQFSEHIRILLLDPRYKDEKSRALLKRAGSNLDFSEVAENAKRIATDESPGSTPDSSKKRKLAWDGYKRSMDTIRFLAEKNADKDEEERQKQRLLEKQRAIGAHRPS